MKPLRVFIGYDPEEPVALHVLHQSILDHASVPVSITPLKLSQLPMHRERDPLQSTEFSFSRFLVPYLCDYEGVALFMDCDMLVQADIKELFDQFDPNYVVQCVKHAYEPSTEFKFLDHIQSVYAFKNWSSVMLFNNSRCRKLTPELVNGQTGLYLHQFQWISGDLNQWIGGLGPMWNHLVGEPSPDYGYNLYNLHYTLGGPWFKEYRDTEFAAEWRTMYYRTIYPIKNGEELRNG